MTTKNTVTSTGTAKNTSKKTSSASSASSTKGNDVKNGVTLNKAFANMSVEDLQAQLEARREAEIADLRAQLEKINTEKDTVEQRMAALTGVVRGRRSGAGKGSRGPRVKNERPLAQYLHEILKSAKEPLSSRQLEEKLSETDYKSDAKNKYVIIYTALSKHPDMFRKTERGLFEAI